MSGKNLFLRYASLNEQRCISREDLGFYHGIVIGAIYEFESGFDVGSPQSFFAPLKHCIDEQVYLGVTVADRHTDKAFFQRAPQINLADHVTVLDRIPAGSGGGSSRWDAIEAVVQTSLNAPFRQDIPPWRIVVLPLQHSDSPTSSSYFIAFVYSHQILDGPSGNAFHKMFLAGLRTAADDAQVPMATTVSVIETRERPLPATLDAPGRLPLSWAYLVSALATELLPRWLAGLLGFTPAVDGGTWTGAPAFFDAATTRTRAVVREISAPLVDRALRASRANGARFTGTMLQLIARALSKALTGHPGAAAATNFVSGVPANLRAAAGVPLDEMGQFYSGTYVKLPLVVGDGPLSADEWAGARESTLAFADVSSRLRDQPFALLRYLPSIRGWMAGKLGKPRDVSFELSNVGVFHDDDEKKKKKGAKKVEITHAVFAQPGHVTGPPLTFNTVTVKGGSLVYTVTWPEGSALGIPEEDEEEFVNGICDSIEADFGRF
ncbi:hypothetical protein B0T24DRAFT_648645 [Lasiosphaeria ovina]|uniref:Alcohol acetyltransferase n=1 Tax=Lasiosphaeria ovina TaxID=92902 RepID=A0AAE0KIN8_9PEZI|nr:hypothetical protein B0T24DRAFT_648645 [Lasiosphaeria ovina]